MFCSRKAYLAQQYKKILYHTWSYRITIDENMDYDRRLSNYSIKLIMCSHYGSRYVLKGCVKKRPKGPHIVHLSTICHLFEESAKADLFVYWLARKTPTWKKTLRSCFLSSFVEFRSAVLEGKSKMSQPIRGRSEHLVFPIGPKNTNLVEDKKILLSVKCGWIPYSGFRGEVENVSANQRPGRPSCFSDPPGKHKLRRGRWDLASCQVSLNSV